MLQLHHFDEKQPEKRFLLESRKTVLRQIATYQLQTQAAFLRCRTQYRYLTCQQQGWTPSSHILMACHHYEVTGGAVLLPSNISSFWASPWLCCRALRACLQQDLVAGATKYLQPLLLLYFCGISLTYTQHTTFGFYRSEGCRQAKSLISKVILKVKNLVLNKN